MALLRQRVVVELRVRLAHNILCSGRPTEKHLRAKRLEITLSFDLLSCRSPVWFPYRKNRKVYILQVDYKYM